MEAASKHQLLASSRVLIAEEAAASRAHTRAMLQGLGFTQFEEAANGKQVLEKITTWQPDLVLMDYTIGGPDGEEVCRAVRSWCLPAQPVMLVLTSTHRLEHKIGAMAAGATDYIAKPLEPSELLARSLIHLEKRTQITAMQHYSSRVKRELQQAAGLQESLLPSEQEQAAMLSGYGVEMASYFKSSSELGGDLWGMRPLGENRFALFTADFSGHGIQAAFNTFRLHTLLEEVLEPDDPAHVLEWLNGRLRGLLEIGQFATMFYAIIDTQANLLRYATAGAPLPLCVRGDTVAYLSGSGLPLACTEKADYTNEQVPFSKGDSLLLYSDALTEALNANEIPMGEDKLRESFSLKPTCGETLGYLLQYLYAHRGTTSIDDDLTLVYLKRR